MPGHPPCALISLIFSSLDPETNWSTSYVRFRFLLSDFSVRFQRSLLRCNWSIFRIILCAVVKVQAASLHFFCFRFQNCFETVQFSLSRTLKTIQNFSSQTQQISSLTLCVLFADPSFSSSAADFCQPRCPVTAPYWSTCFAFASLVNQIDL